MRKLLILSCDIVVANERCIPLFKWISHLDAAINYRFIVCRLDTVQHVLGILTPIIRSLSTAAAASGLPIVIRDNVL